MHPDADLECNKNVYPLNSPTTSSIQALPVAVFTSVVLLNLKNKSNIDI